MICEKINFEYLTYYNMNKLTMFQLKYLTLFFILKKNAFGIEYDV